MHVRVSVETVSIACPVWCTVPLRGERVKKNIAGCFSGSQTALLVLTTAATWTRVIAPHFRTGLDLGGLEHLHQALGWLPGTPQRCQLGDVRAAIGEEAFVAGTQVVQ